MNTICIFLESYFLVDKKNINIFEAADKIFELKNVYKTKFFQSPMYKIGKIHSIIKKSDIMLDFKKFSILWLCIM